MMMTQAYHARRQSLLRRFFPRNERKGLYSQTATNSGMRSYMVMPGQPVWMDRDYSQFAREAYIRNVIAHRSIGMVAGAGASVRMKLYAIGAKGTKREIKAHPALDILKHPNPLQSASEFFQALYQYRLIGGNAFIQAVGPQNSAPGELHLLRPDRVAILAGKGALPAGYRYTVGDQYTDFPVDKFTGMSRVLHLKYFHPLNDWYGLSPVEAAAYSIDQHNQSGAWNQALMQNGARPSGALVVRVDANGGGGMLSEDQYNRIKNQIDDQFSGPSNSGRPLLLEGGLDWKEMSLTPKDMDFIQAKNSAARDIALAFGVPPQMLGIPGDNTYANLQEARLALWEQTVVPMVWSITDALNRWLLPMFRSGLEFAPDVDAISALAPRNQAIWDRVQSANFLTTDEKRAAVGYGPISTDQINSAAPRKKRSRNSHYRVEKSWPDDGDDDDGGDRDNVTPSGQVMDDSARLYPADIGDDNVDPFDSWGRSETLDEHFDRHGDDFNADSVEDYVRQANQFLQDAQDNDYPTILDKDGNIRAYDPDSNAFGTYNSDHTTRSFFKPDEGSDYFDTQINKHLSRGGQLIKGSDIPDAVDLDNTIAPDILE